MSIHVARTAADLEHKLAQSRIGFTVQRVPAVSADWGLVDGALQHTTRGFFSVNGVRLASGDERVLLFQPQGAVTGLLNARIDGERCFLLQARAEPGCLGEAQFGPTVQSTPANFLQMHGGATTPYIRAFVEHTPFTSVVDDTTQLDLGERYLCKSKRSILAETTAPQPAQAAFVWASCDALREAVLRSAFLNIDLRSILSIAGWQDGHLSPRNREVQASAAAPLRADVLGEVVRALAAAGRPQTQVVPLEDLVNWYADEWGWREREARQGFAVEFYEVTAAHREKASWVQPLVNSHGEGRAVLACRERSGVLEFLVTVAAEPGLATGAALAPSVLTYPGSALHAPRWLDASRLWTSTVESDEGGRFFRDVSRYETVRIDDWAGDTDGFWLTLAELKAMLRTSNACTIQLRGVVSQLLGAE